MVLTNYKFILFFFTLCMKKPELEASKTCMIGMYAFMLSSLLISRKAVKISHTHVENYMHACAGLDFVSCHEPTKWSQSGGWQPPQPPEKVATSIYVLSS